MSYILWYVSHQGESDTKECLQTYKHVVVEYITHTSARPCSKVSGRYDGDNIITQKEIKIIKDSAFSIDFDLKIYIYFQLIAHVS